MFVCNRLVLCLCKACLAGGRIKDLFQTVVVRVTLGEKNPDVIRLNNTSIPHVGETHERAAQPRLSPLHISDESHELAANLRIRSSL